MIAFRRLRQDAVQRRFDFEAPIARAPAGTGVIMANMRIGIDIAAAVDGGLDMLALGEAPIAFDDGIGSIDTVDDDGDARTTGNHDIETVTGQGRRCGPDQKCQSKPCARHQLFHFHGNLADGAGPSVKAATSRSINLTRGDWRAPKFRQTDSKALTPRREARSRSLHPPPRGLAQEKRGEPELHAGLTRRMAGPGTSPAACGYDPSWAARNGFVCQPGTWFKGKTAAGISANRPRRCGWRRLRPPLL